MVNLATCYLLVAWITFLFMNPNNCSYTTRILCGVRYCLLKSISFNFKIQRSEVSSMCIGIKMQNKPHMHSYVISIFCSSYVFLLRKWNIESITQKAHTLFPCFCWRVQLSISIVNSYLNGREVPPFFTLHVYTLYNFDASLELGSNISMCNKALTK
jgi:hypothetical protein